MMRVATGQKVLVRAVDMNRRQVFKLIVGVYNRAAGLVRVASIGQITAPHTGSTLLYRWRSHPIHVIQIYDAVVRSCYKLRRVMMKP
eukprot:scaffold552_cov526-Prasinococcus_capsulatus_cf.AAC.16